MAAAAVLAVLSAQPYQVVAAAAAPGALVVQEPRLAVLAASLLRQRMAQVVKA